MLRGTMALASASLLAKTAAGGSTKGKANNTHIWSLIFVEIVAPNYLAIISF